MFYCALQKSGVVDGCTLSRIGAHSSMGALVPWVLHLLRRRPIAGNVSTSLLPYGGITYFINSFVYHNLLCFEVSFQRRAFTRAWAHLWACALTPRNTILPLEDKMQKLINHKTRLVKKISAITVSSFKMKLRN